MNPLVVFIPILALIFDACCLIDLSRAEEVRYLPPIWWLFVIGFLTPFGGIAYPTVGRVRQGAEPGPSSGP